ncbi:uncharacterized protein LOC123031543 [Varanus komodoensis]|uniref:uncharacterized protein LOC123031543 n=1 Tax=Varanus komodoensis TaxID=61221 RepID=UPI001CF7E53E|nr:uncharacterized protein LOC123031543 [Varanus komodoensis]
MPSLQGGKHIVPISVLMPPGMVMRSPGTSVILAVFKALQSFKLTLRGQVVQIASDNVVTVFYINKQGGMKSVPLAHLGLRIWDWCIPRGMTLLTVHLTSVDNEEADALSRWMSTTHHIFQHWGTPDIDLFATVDNAVYTNYCSWAGIGPNSLGDALMVNWANMFFYAFPPIPLIAKTLTKNVQDEAQGILIMPWWPCQPWFPTILSLFKKTFFCLSRVLHLITQENRVIRHPDLNSLNLTAWLIQGLSLFPLP